MERLYVQLVTQSRPRGLSRRDASPMSATVPDAELRDRILTALVTLLESKRFAEISVAAIIRTAKVSRASFYFYFASKQAVLGELVKDAVGQGMQAAEPWVASSQEPLQGLLAGVRSGAELWRRNAGVLKAIVESWGTDDALRQLWLDQMNTFTQAAAARIRTDSVALEHLDGLEVDAVAASLTWLGERMYYLAAAGVPPFNDESVLIDTLTNAWTSSIYGQRVSQPADDPRAES